MTRFDPREGEPLGSCKDCGITLEDQTEMSAHLSETWEQSTSDPKKGHTASVSNPTRADRIRTHLEFVAQDAIYGFLEDVERDIDRGDITEDEVADGLRMMPDFSDAWMNRENS